MTTPPAKQVIYVDVDDEITAIIDKINTSDARVIALVLPKRAAVFQSVVNMKLLKRRAESAKKHLVLITSEIGLMPLAGMVGVHVAPTLQSKPEIPVGPADADAGFNEAADEVVDADAPDGVGGSEFDPATSAAIPVGALAASQAGNMAGDVEETVELDNSAKGLKDKFKGGGPLNGTTNGKAKSKPDKSLRVPNFFSFRKKLMLGILAVILLGVGWYYAFVVMPKASITISTNSSDIANTFDLTLDTAASKTDADKLIIPAQTKQEQKSNTQDVPATGQQNKGDKATGAVSMAIPCSAVSGDPIKIPAGTGISSAGLVYITQTTVELSTPAFSGGTCKFTGSTNVTAEKSGTAYNIAPASFTVSGYTSIQASSSAAMAGGTDNNVKVVQQSDIDAAKQKLSAAQDQSAIKRQLEQELQDANLYPLTASFNVGEPNVNANNNVGEEADKVTVTQSTTYTMFGVHQDDLNQLVEANVVKKIDPAKQSILDNGVKDAKITVPTPGVGPQIKVSMAVTSTAGPKLDVEAIKQQAKGLKSGEVRDKIKQNIGVKDATVNYSPFWVNKAPKASRITVVFEKSATANSSGGDSTNSSSGGATNNGQ